MNGSLPAGYVGIGKTCRGEKEDINGKEIRLSASVSILCDWVEISLVKLKVAMT